MGVRVGSARSNENGGVNGGKAGDQTGREVSTQPGICIQRVGLLLEQSHLQSGSNR